MLHHKASVAADVPRNISVDAASILHERSDGRAKGLFMRPKVHPYAFISKKAKIPRPTFPGYPKDCSARRSGFMAVVSSVSDNVLLPVAAKSSLRTGRTAPVSMRRPAFCHHPSKNPRFTAGPSLRSFTDKLSLNVGSRRLKHPKASRPGQGPLVSLTHRCTRLAETRNQSLHPGLDEPSGGRDVLGIRSQ